MSKETGVGKAELCSGKVKIVSDGTAVGTRVFAGNAEIKGVYAIEFERIVPDEFIRVTLGIHSPKLEIVATLLEQGSALIEGEE